MTYRALLPFATRSLGNFYTRNRDLDRLFDACGTTAAVANSGLGPLVDVLESQDGFAIIAELPGVAAADINIDVEDNTVTLWGDKKPATVADGIKQHRAERRTGAFRRSFALPVELDADRVSASFKNGVLTIDLPRSAVEQPKVKKVAIQTA